MRKNLLSTVFLLSTTALSAPVVAQTADAPQAQGGIQDIVVTARKVGENLQTAPVAVSAISGDALVNQQIVGIQQIQSTTPNLQFSSGVAQPGSSTVFIRGQGSPDGLVAIDQAVGVYVDGVYAARSTGGATDLIDTQRVEVLRGPQGTLFGRNTTGGAVNIITNRPTDKFEGSLRADCGNYDSILLQGVVNVPITSAIAARAVVQHREHEGYGYNAFLRRDINDLRADYYRLSVGFTPEDSKFSALVSFDASSFETNGEQTGLKLSAPNAGIGTLQLVCGTGTLAGPLAGFAAVRPLCPTTSAGAFSSYALGTNGNTFYRTNGNVDTYGKNDTYGASVVLDYEVSEALKLKSTTAWRGVELKALSDNDGTPYAITGGVNAFPGSPPGNYIKQDQFSQELQLSGNIGKFEYIAGAFYFGEKGQDQSNSGSVFPLRASISIVDGVVKNSSLAGYGQIIYSLTDTIRLTGGLRYTEDKRELDIRNRTQPVRFDTATNSIVLNGSPTSDLRVTNSSGVVLSSLLNGGPGDPFLASFERKFSYTSYLLSADWQATDDLFLYAKTSRSQRSGGLNTRAVAGGVPPMSFSPEIVTDYEIGAKVDLFDRRVRVNGAVFTSEVEDVQRNVTGISPVTGSLVGGQVNAAAATISGLELELTLAPTDNLTIGGNLGLLDASYDKFLNGDGADFSGAEFPYTPEATAAIFVDYVANVAAGKLKLHADYGWRSDQYAVGVQARAAERVGRTAAEIAALNNAYQETAKIDSYGLLNLRAAYQLESPNVEFAIYGRNVLEEEYITRMLGVQQDLGFTSYIPGDPQTYGVSVAYKF